MSNVAIFILACWGLTHLIVSGKILERPRNWLIIKSPFLEGLLTCYQCTGFWTGIILAFYWTNDLWHVLLMACISSGAVSFINSAYVLLITSISNKQKSQD